jgi:hypothetical protein
MCPYPGSKTDAVFASQNSKNQNAAVLAPLTVTSLCDSHVAVRLSPLSQEVLSSA